MNFRCTALFFCIVFIGWTLPAGTKHKPLEDVKAEVSAAFNSACEKLLIDNISKAGKTIYAAVYTFAKKSIADALIERAEHGVKISLKLDAVQAEFSYTKFLIKRMESAGILIQLITMKKKGSHMHHKFAVIDGKTTVTGSFNWTRSATEFNNENIISVTSDEIAEAYMNEWNEIGKH